MNGTLTHTTLDVGAASLAATVKVASPAGAPMGNLYVTLAEADLLTAATAAGRTDWTTADVVTLAAAQLGFAVAAA